MVGFRVRADILEVGHGRYVPEAEVPARLQVYEQKRIRSALDTPPHRETISATSLFVACSNISALPSASTI